MIAREIAIGASAGSAKRSNVFSTAVQLLATPVISTTRQHRVKQPDRERQLLRRKVRCDQREHPPRAQPR
jgi:hypothetical protein